MTFAQFATTMIGPIGAVVIAGVILWFTRDKPGHHHGK